MSNLGENTCCDQLIILIVGFAEGMIAPALPTCPLSYSGLSEKVWTFKIPFNPMSIESIFGVQMTFEPSYSRVQATGRTGVLQMAAVWNEVTFKHE